MQRERRRGVYHLRSRPGSWSNSTGVGGHSTNQVCDCQIVFHGSCELRRSRLTRSSCRSSSLPWRTNPPAMHRAVTFTLSKDIACFTSLRQEGEESRGQVNGPKDSSMMRERKEVITRVSSQAIFQVGSRLMPSLLGCKSCIWIWPRSCNYLEG